MQQINLNDHEKAKIHVTKGLAYDIAFRQLKKPLAVSALFLALMCVYAATSHVLGARTEAAHNAYSRYLSDEMAKNTTAPHYAPKQVVIPSEDAVDMEKIESDIASAHAVFSDIFNWSDGDAYDAARERVISLFGEGSGIAGLFTENARLESGANYVDTIGANMKFTGATDYPVSINPDGDNSYFSIVSVRSSSESQQTTSSYEIAVQYTVGADGNLSGCSVSLLPYRGR